MQLTQRHLIPFITSWLWISLSPSNYNGPTLQSALGNLWVVIANNKLGACCWSMTGWSKTLSLLWKLCGLTEALPCLYKFWYCGCGFCTWFGKHESLQMMCSLVGEPSIWYLERHDSGSMFVCLSLYQVGEYFLFPHFVLHCIILVAYLSSK